MRQLRQKTLEQFAQNGTTRQWWGCEHRQSSFKVPAPLCHVASDRIKFMKWKGEWDVRFLEIILCFYSRELRIFYVSDTENQSHNFSLRWSIFLITFLVYDWFINWVLKDHRRSLFLGRSHCVCFLTSYKLPYKSSKFWTEKHPALEMEEAQGLQRRMIQQCQNYLKG